MELDHLQNASPTLSRQATILLGYPLMGGLNVSVDVLNLSQEASMKRY